MFKPPRIVQANIFAKVPAKFRVRGRQSEWAKMHRPGVETDSFLEGPSFDREGNLYVVDVAWGRVFRVDREGQFSIVTEYDGNPNGLKIHADGRAFVADFTLGLIALDLRTGRVSSIAKGYAGKLFNGLNDLYFATNGDLYFTDQGLSGLHDTHGRVFRLRSNGRLELVLDGIPSPNGLVVDPGNRTLFLNVTRDNSVWRVPMRDDGFPYKVGAFIRLSGGIGPDGLAMDSSGGLAVAHIGLGCIWYFDQLGQPILRINSPVGRMTTNVAYGGPDNRTLFITESETGSILSVELAEPGQKTFALS